ncbi:hypothetical protein NX722_17570 [Endozoicomonas gorgoniicola]|uniref:Uncharacterized protein n=1 Tax=Endozoicomonas gorgoniicola TaxID=1234144 RepID=A0ABT3MYE4_9GAMM|nr:hypothetical protein [Endozoicomonas gorgoniicola]MCW7554396.1 hypothetical protein [Endozoicomonas gorgoniicola]
MSRIFLTLVIVVAAFLGLTKNQEMIINSDTFYLQADFPRFTDKPLYVIKLGERPGLGGMVDGVKSQLSR